MEFHPVVNTPADGSSSSSPAPVPLPAGSWHKHPGKANRPDNAAIRSFLTAEQLAEYDRDGFLLIKAKDVWTPSELKLILASAEMMDNWPDQAGKWMKYYEKDRKNPDGKKILCRIENFTQYNPGLDYILNGDKILNLASDLFNEQAILYKEKINYKLPGGDGFAPHQDVAAGWWMYGQTLHLSCLISIDPATVQNGCLEVVRGQHLDGMMCEDWKGIPEETVQKLKWETVPTEPGDVLFFDSYVPHRSEPNNTDKPRRVLYSTYAKAAEGDYRNRYYADKRLSFPPDIERDPSKVYEYKI